jgi:uridine phosphorylase
VTIHLRPSGAIASDVLLPGDPARAMTLAQQLLTEPKMHNLHRGLWGYSGETAGGRRLSIQSTGMGGPSAAIVLTELAELGVTRAIRVGTCGALDPGLELGELLRVEAALPADGASRALGASEPVPADADLLAALAAARAGRPVIAATTDLFYEPTDQPRRGWIEAGAAAVEMEAAPLLALGPRLGVAVACLVVVSDVHRDGRRERIGDDALATAVEGMGAAAAAALEA